jgi:hypothetical protein
MITDEMMSRAAAALEARGWVPGGGELRKGLRAALEAALEDAPGSYQAPHEIDELVHFDLKQNAHVVAEFFYPGFGEPEQPKVTVGLCHVRAADSITIYFDGDRNGYVITMDKTKEASGMMEAVEKDAEVAFIPAWNCDE